ncbi:hypothetical protein FACS189413_04510 [Bacteroidia bacterium]|nr:hypothetical protein FACS189413_04510 [Bacteroidia bacterium]
MTLDIALSGEWITIGTWGGDGATGAFQGHFDGDGHTVTGLQVTTGGDRGLFGWVKNATIKNLIVHTNATGISGNIETGDNYAILAGSAGNGWIDGNTTIENCVVSGTVNGSAVCGALVGQSSHITVLNCQSENVTIKGTRWNISGLIGVIGCLYNQATITGSSATSTINSFGDCAGFVGLKLTTGIISHCKAFANIKARNYTTIVGGFVAYNEGSGVIDNCLFAGSIEVENPGLAEFTNAKVGGFTGRSWARITNSAALAVINNKIENDRVWGTGGFVGALNDESKSGTLENCWFSGSVKGNGIVGGMVGFSNIINGSGEIKNCYVMADVEVNGTAGGGFAGLVANGSPAITNAYFTGNITGADGAFAGSFAGYAEAGAVLNNCAVQTVAGLENIAVDEGSLSVTAIAASDLKKQNAWPAAWFASDFIIQEEKTYPYFATQLK